MPFKLKFIALKVSINKKKRWYKYVFALPLQLFGDTCINYLEGEIEHVKYSMCGLFVLFVYLGISTFKIIYQI